MMTHTRKMRESQRAEDNLSCWPVNTLTTVANPERVTLIFNFGNEAFVSHLGFFCVVPRHPLCLFIWHSIWSGEKSKWAETEKRESCCERRTADGENSLSRRSTINLFAVVHGDMKISFTVENEPTRFLQDE